MVNEKIEDTQKFKTYDGRVTVYGSNLLAKLQETAPQRNLIGRTWPVYDPRGGFPISADYFIGEEVNVPRKGFKRLLGKTEKKIRVLFDLRTNSSADSAYRAIPRNYSAVIRDPGQRSNVEKILMELDAKSGEKYSSNIGYSNDELFIPFKQPKRPFEYYDSGY